MAKPKIAGSREEVLVEDFYRRLAVDRTARAGEALLSEPVAHPWSWERQSRSCSSEAQ